MLPLTFVEPFGLPPEGTVGGAGGADCVTGCVCVDATFE